MVEDVEPLISTKEIGNRILWLILLRWIAVVCLFIAITTSHFMLKVTLDLALLYIGNAALLLLNIAYRVFYGRLDFSNSGASLQGKVNIFINLQISLDLTLLMYLIHFAGGAENPFFVFFVFHMVIASILLSNRAAYLQAAYASVIFCGVTIAEYIELIPLHQLHILSQTPRYLPGIYQTAGAMIAVISAMFITVYMSTTIMNKLRERELEISTARSQLELTNTQLKRKDFEKSRYIQSLTHNIKGSLSSIQICLRVVLEGFTGEVSDKSVEMIARSEKRSRILLEFVRDLYFLSMLRTTDKIETLSILISDCVMESAEELEKKLHEKDIKLDISGISSTARMQGNVDLLKRIFAALLDNAARYTPNGGTVAVSVGDVSVNGRVAICIADNGIGLADADAKHVFEDFYRAHIPENESSNLPGLGLPLVARIVEMHGGSVSLVSELHAGSSFKIEFPAYDLKEDV